MHDINKKSVFPLLSLILAAAPIAILLIVFLFCLFVSVVIPDSGSVIWWLLIATIMILIPVAIVTDILSITFGIFGLKSNKTVFAWIGIIIVSLEVLAAAVILLIWG